MPSNPHQDSGKVDPGPPLCRQCCSYHPHWKSPVVHQNSLCRCCSALQPWGQPQEEGGSPPPRCIGRLPPPIITISETELKSVQSWSQSNSSPYCILDRCFRSDAQTGENFGITNPGSVLPNKMMKLRLLLLLIVLMSIMSVQRSFSLGCWELTSCSAKHFVGIQVIARFTGTFERSLHVDAVLTTLPKHLTFINI